MRFQKPAQLMPAALLTASLLAAAAGVASAQEVGETLRTEVKGEILLEAPEAVSYTHLTLPTSDLV